MLETDEIAKPETENSPETVSWTASEFVAHHKTAGWYVMLVVAAAAIAVAIYLITRDYISVGVVIGAAIILGIYGSHQPRQLEYKLDQRGIEIGPKRWSYNEFRCFSVIPDGAFSNIVLMPLKRFAAPISIYYDPEDEERILAVLNKQLPFEQARRDALDSLLRRIRF